MFDFALLENEDFKEDSVREAILTPLLRELGFVDRKLHNPRPLELARSLKITSPTIVGSNEKIILTRFPDYVLYVDSKPHCVLDAKSPHEIIQAQSKNERQVFYYAINPEMKTPFYALCNGKSFMLFETNGQILIKEFACEELFRHAFKNESFALLKQYLTMPLESLRQNLAKDSKIPAKSEEWYLSRELPKAIVNPKKQAKARYFGCTAYFTRQSWDIVEKNILNFTDEGDVVLDPFGGSGVTAIEAMMNGRIGIHVDLNPLSVFMAKALSAKVDLGKLYELSEEILGEFENLRPKNEREARKILKDSIYYPNAIDSEFGEVATQKEQEETLWIPKDEALPKGSDVPSVLQLFSKVQLAELALLRKLIFKHTTPSGNKENRIYKRNMRYALMLAFYNTLTMCNLTYHTTEYNKKQKNAGSSGIFFYYRYRIAKEHVHVEIAETFMRKIHRVCKGKQELENAASNIFYQSYLYPLENVIKDFKGAMLSQREKLAQSDSRIHKSNGERIFQADATNLQEIEKESVDFIYTDPPYGAKIPYLDLSTMWNAWLDFPVDFALKSKECIEKGSLEKSRYEYYDLMKASLKEMYRVLKWNRWLAFVFQHQDPKLWQILVDSAENIGFEYVGSVRQDNGQASFKKVQNPITVLSGQIIIYFKKVDNAKVRAKLEVGMNIMEQMFQDIEAIIVENNGANLNEIWNGLIIKAVEGNYIDMIAKKFENFIPAINERFELDKETKKYHLHENASFSNYDIPIEKRVEYFIRAILGRAKEKGHGVSFNDIVFQVIPLTKNGVQANNKLIRDILEEIAYEDKDSGEWRPKGGEMSLFRHEDWCED
ncbi:MAG: type I restriction enzyme HsdR N-terminal domain-containing protein [Helicobacter sp.]|nr:type I restriction enzyme HsdR N-terminal domain-containing protein [Helicobacter sp.]